MIILLSVSAFVGHLQGGAEQKMLVVIYVIYVQFYMILMYLRVSWLIFRKWL